MKALFLGTGTSVGVPVIGCRCAVCTSSDPRNRRRRTSLYVESGPTHLLIDTPPEFREQVLQHGVDAVDAILLTHTHADHIFGFDDVRAFNVRGAPPMPVYGSPDTLANMRRIFNYVEVEPAPGRYRPRVRFQEFTDGMTVGAIAVEPLAVEHEVIATHGFVLRSEGRSLGYFPDCRRMPDEVVERLHGIDVMILDALRERPHPAHLSIPESLELLVRIGARRAYLIHMCHDVDHETVERGLPDGVRLSYDGLTLEW